MANVFLSYHRQDATKARPLAAALEKAGHSVWWDQHIQGGAQYSKEIEQALKRADVVVVLWSETAVDSAWVRDEAAAGRDSGRLVPATLDGTEPPLGFRQYQTLDLSAGSGRWKAAQLTPFTEAVASVAGGGNVQVQARPRPRPVRADRFFGALLANPWRVIALVIGLIVFALGLAISRPWERKPHGISTVAVTSADSRAEPLAQSLLLKLAALPSAQSGSVKLIGSDASEAKADLIFKASLGAGGSGALALLAGEDFSVLWTKQFEPSNSDLAQRQSFAAAKVLQCAMEGLSDRNARLDQQELKVYLNACATMADIGWDKRPVLASLRGLTQSSPQFEAAWAKLLVAEIDAISFEAIGSRERGNFDQLRRDVAAARKADPDLAEATLAEAFMQRMPPIGPILELLDRAKAQNPTSSAVLNERTMLLVTVGRLRDALADAKQLSDSDPLSPESRVVYIRTLADAGQLDSARRELNEAQRIWPDAKTIAQTAQTLEFRFGDFEKAVASGDIANGPGSADYLAMRRNPSDDNVERFFRRVLRIDLNPDQIVFALQAFSEVGRPDKAYEILSRPEAARLTTEYSYVFFRPYMRAFRADSRFMSLANRLALVDYWRSTDKWPDFCEDPALPYDCKTETAKLH